MNTLLNLNDMSDEQLEVINSQAVGLRINRLFNQVKDLKDDITKIGLNIGLVENKNKELNKKLEDQEEVVVKLGETLKVTSIDRFQHDEMQDIMKKRVFHFVGKISSDKYILFYKGYKASLVSSVKKEFGKDDIPLSSIRDLKLSDFENAKTYINKWKPSQKLNNDILSKWTIKDANDDIKPSEKKAFDKIMSKLSEI